MKANVITLILFSVFYGHFAKVWSGIETFRTRNTIPKSQLKSQLTDLEYHVTQEQGTEPSKSGKYWDHLDEGFYHCKVCDKPMFDSAVKYDDDIGYAAFHGSMEDVAEIKLPEFNGKKRMVKCFNCGSHLGYAYVDPRAAKAWQTKYFINSASLHFRPDVR